ncbi:hypothetical protein ACHAXR_009947, partial [Thalassiosira sp. AJA248-18]
EGRAVSNYDVESWREFLAATSSAVDADDEDSGDWRLSKGSISLHYAEEEWETYKSLRDSVLHIDLRNWADVCLIAPLSAHTLAKLANGLCDDLLSCCMRAWDFGQRKLLNGDNRSAGKPVILAPAMNTAMWDHPLTGIQLETIRQFTGSKKLHGYGKESKGENGVITVEPAVKTLACGEVGAGALAELDDIISAVKKCLIQWNTNAGMAKVSNDATAYSSNARRESMKKALLLYAKQRFSDLKSSHEQSMGPNSSTSKLAAPISPTPKLIIEAFLPRLNLNSNSFLVDLGCGDGRWLIAANESTHCRCIGIDVDEERLKTAQDSILKSGLQEMIEVRRRDIFDFVRSDDIYRADVIVIYLFREVMLEMGQLLHQRLSLRSLEKGIPQKTVKILSVGFALTGWTSDYEEKIDGIRVYLYSTSSSN